MGSKSAKRTEAARPKYFARTVVHQKRDGKVVLVDMHDASATEALEDWLARVFLLADGSHTVQELIDFAGEQYGGRPPPTLESTIDSVVDRMYRAGVIALSEGPVALPYYLALPADEQDPELANRLMLEDGFQQGAAE